MKKNKTTDYTNSSMFKLNPWHIPIGDHVPTLVTAYIELVPTDTVKYELDKSTGFLRIDRPHKYSSVCPSLYGFIPQTYCGKEVGDLCSKQIGKKDIDGDGDPLDICVITERQISHGDLLLEAYPIGGFRLLDGRDADDKIIAVLRGDALLQETRNLHDLMTSHPAYIERLKHYFLTYKDAPGAKHKRCRIAEVYGRGEAFNVIEAARRDYKNDILKTLQESITP